METKTVKTNEHIAVYKSGQCKMAISKQHGVLEDLTINQMSTAWLDRTQNDTGNSRIMVTAGEFNGFPLVEFPNELEGENNHPIIAEACCTLLNAIGSTEIGRILAEEYSAKFGKEQVA